jgi:SAM-dependent methyltransferase
MTRGRKVVLEILDHLPTDDPAARRSREDLRRINFLMGNERWVCRTLRDFPEAASRGIVELGAGDGILAGKIARLYPNAAVTACDLAPRPASLEKNVRWQRGDLLDGECDLRGGILIANLFLHHFEGDALRKLGSLCEGFDVLVFNEPDRARLPHVLGFTMWPMINHVTRHDMHVSISGGFMGREIPHLLGLDEAKWRISESYTWRGARRVLGCRR